jgi:hypothetical protein
MSHEPTAQDVIDALRFLRMAQKDPVEFTRLVDCLLDFAPETDGNRGLKMIVDMICEGSLKASLVDQDPA